MGRPVAHHGRRFFAGSRRRRFARSVPGSSPSIFFFCDRATFMSTGSTVTAAPLEALATMDHYPAVLRLFTDKTAGNPSGQKPGGRILDVPAGQGAFAQELLK